MVPTDGADHRQPEPGSILIIGSQARNPLAAQLHQFLLNLDPPRPVASVNNSPPSLLANALSVHAPDLVISSIGAPHPSAQDDAAAQQSALVDACLAAGVPRLLLVPLRAASESEHKDADAGGAGGHDWDGLTAGEAQARVLRHLRSVARGSGGDKGEQEQGAGASRTLEWVGVACGTILDAALVNGQFGVDMKWASAEVIGDEAREFGASSTTWVCRAAAAVVEHWDRIPRNQLLHVAGCVTTPNDVLRCLEAVTEQSYLVSFVAVEDAVHEARKHIERGFLDKGAEMLERCNLLALGADEAFKDRSANGLLGLGRESVRDIVGVAVHSFRHMDTAGCGCG
ncbi:hypothetical protein IWX90DRAFT_444984 [Phyllosticta citrichinensis]|uniref:Uncharacterized protein n=1 Tax=Phyllosticta citrichinensis TaxID=1130410 RepID=A0ABR1XGP9_9PEZI